MTVTESPVVAEDADAEQDVLDGQGGDWVHDPMNVPERFPALPGSSVKLLPEPLKLFACLAAICHWYVPLLHGTVALTVSVVCAPDARDRLRNCAEAEVTLVAPGALVLMKTAGAEICTEPSC